MKKIAKKIVSLMKQLLFLRIELLTNNIVPLLVFEILYKVFTVFCTRPLIENIISICMQITGYEYLNDTNIGAFLCHPLCIVVAILLIILIAIFSIIEISALIYIFEQSRRNKKVSLYDIFYYSFKNAVRLVKFKNLPMYFYLLILSPLFNVGATSSFLDSISVPNTALDYVTSNLYAFAFFFVIFVIALFFAYRWIYCLHFFTLEKTNAFESYRKSAKLTRSHRILNFLSMGCIQLIISIVNSFMVWVSGILINNVYGSINVNNNFVEIGWFLLMAAFFLVYLVVYSMYMPLSCLKISSLYYGNKEASGQGFEDIVVEEPEQKGFKFLKKSAKEANKKQIAFVVITVLLILAAIFAGIKYILTEINDSRDNLTETKLVTNEKGIVATDIKTLLDRSKNINADGFMVHIYISGCGEPYCVSNKTIMTIFDTVQYPIKEVSLSEIRNEFDSMIEDKEEYSGEKSITKLEDLLEYAKNVDIDLILDTSDTSWYAGSEDIICKAIINYGCKESLSICSNNADSLSKIKEIDIDINTIYKQTVVIGDFKDFKVAADAVMLDDVSLTRSQVSQLHENGYKVIAWSRGSKNAIKKATNYGVDCLFVSNALQAKKVLATSDDYNFANKAFRRYAFISLFRELV